MNFILLSNSFLIIIFFLKSRDNIPKLKMFYSRFFLKKDMNIVIVTQKKKNTWIKLISILLAILYIYLNNNKKNHFKVKSKIHSHTYLKMKSITTKYISDVVICHFCFAYFKWKNCKYFQCICVTTKIIILIIFVFVKYKRKYEKKKN